MIMEVEVTSTSWIRWMLAHGKARDGSDVERERQKLRSRKRFPSISRAMHAGGRPCFLL